MKLAIFLCACGMGTVNQMCAQTLSSTPATTHKRTVIAVSTALDGKGHLLRDTRIVIEGPVIGALDPKAEPVDYDLRGLTVLPGWIDSHVHITWSFGRDGKNAGQGGTSPDAAYASGSNAWLTLMAGFTTVQDVGSPAAIPLRDAISQGALPGPRILTAAEPLMEQGEKTATPDEIRAFVRKQKEAGADLIKIYASGGMTRGKMTMSQEQLNAACDEARKLGLRSLVHAHRDAVRAATLAGCTEIEHGLGASDDDLRLMAERVHIWTLRLGCCWRRILSTRTSISRRLTTPRKASRPCRISSLHTRNSSAAPRVFRV